MAKRAKNNNRRNSEDKDLVLETGLSPDTKRGILTVLVFLLAMLGIMSVFGLAGNFGRSLNYGLSYLFGWSDWLFLIILLYISFLILRSNFYKIRWVVYLGIFLIVLSSAGLLNFFVSDYTWAEIGSLGKGGGVLGYAIGHPLASYLGAWGSLVVFISLLLIGIFLAFNTSFKDMTERAKSLGILREKLLPSDDDDVEDEEEGNFESDTVLEKTELLAEDADPRVEPGGEAAVEGKENIAFKKIGKKIVVPLDLLSKSSSKPDSGDVSANMNKIEKTLKNFGIEVTMEDVNVGPTVTQYTLRPAEGVRLSQMLTLQNDLALALAAHPLRMEAPIPGKSLVGIEVPNKSISVVKLREVLESDIYKKRNSNLYIALGKDVAGEVVMYDLANMPHLLIAGSTGSGKSVAINNVILSLIYQNSPDDLKLILIDPKRVELAIFNDIPYLLTPVINDTDKTINALRYVVKEMQERYKLLQAANKKNIESYNKSVIVNRLPYIVVIIDEFAALMSSAAKEIEGTVVSLAQMARAVGIHLILATQRPSVDVITGLIKANITCRIAFAVASATDSRTIIDTSGADKLLGKGDMLFISSDSSKPRRIQGVFTREEEIKAVVDYIRGQAEPEYNDKVTERASGVVPGFGGGDGDYNDDLTEEAKEVILKTGRASATLLQRRLRVGYARAARLLDILEEMGVVGPADGSKAREVLVAQEDLEENFSSALDEEDLADASEPEEDSSAEEEGKY